MVQFDHTWSSASCNCNSLILVNRFSGERSPVRESYPWGFLGFPSQRIIYSSRDWEALVVDDANMLMMTFSPDPTQRLVSHRSNDFVDGSSKVACPRRGGFCDGDKSSERRAKSMFASSGIGSASANSCFSTRARAFYHHSCSRINSFAMAQAVGSSIHSAGPPSVEDEIIKSCPKCIN